MSLNSHFNIFVGDFNINWFDEIIRRPLYNFFNDNNYRQLVSSFTTDNLDLPQVDPEASKRLAAKLRGARSTCFACKNIHLIKILARKLI